MRSLLFLIIIGLTNCYLIYIGLFTHVAQAQTYSSISENFNGKIYSKTWDEIKKAKVYHLDVNFSQMKYSHERIAQDYSSQNSTQQSQTIQLFKTTLDLISGFPGKTEQFNTFSYVADVAPIESKADEKTLDNDGIQATVNLDDTGKYLITTRKLKTGYNLEVLLNLLPDTDGLISIDTNLKWSKLNNFKQDCQTIEAPICIQRPALSSLYINNSIVINPNENKWATIQIPLDKETMLVMNLFLREK